MRRQQSVSVLLAVALPCLVLAQTPTEDDPRTPPGEPGGEVGRKHSQPTFELINKSTNLLGWGDPNPVAVVRAVNHLRSLGKNDAIEALRAYVRYAPQYGTGWESDSADQQRLVWIIPLLFVPSNPDIKLPTLGRNPEFPEWTTGDKWEPFYISLAGDLPFHNVKFGGRRGKVDPDRGYLVEWVSKHAHLRAEPLRPVDDPLGAADGLCDKLSKDALNEDHAQALRYHIRQQAWRTIAHLISVEEKNRWPGWPSDDEWERIKEEAAKLNIRWSEEAQDYVGGE